jgi:methionyl-tRNA formyltransferase
MTPLNIVFYSSSSFCLPILEQIVNNPELYNLLGVVTQPDWTNRGKIYTNPISHYCKQNNIRLFQPYKLNKSFDEYKEFFPIIDLGVVASYGQIISTQILEHAKYGMINWHPSALPKYRGPTPIQTSLLNGDTQGALTWIVMDKGMDSGDIISSINVDYQEMGFGELSVLIGELGRQTLDEVVIKHLNNQASPQDHTQATFTHIINKDDGLIENHLLLSNAEILRRIKAYDVFPKTKIITVKYGMIKLISVLPMIKDSIKINYEDSNFYYSSSNLYLKTLNGVLTVKEFQLDNGRYIKLKQ